MPTVREQIAIYELALAELRKIPVEDLDLEVRFPDSITRPVVIKPETRIYCNWDCSLLRPCGRGCTHYSDDTPIK